MKRRGDEWKTRTKNVWGATPAGALHAPHLQPGSPEYFREVLHRRSAEELPWLNAVAPFELSRGMVVTEIGCGAGYDAYHFAVNGARYIGIDLVEENLRRTRQHLRAYGFDPLVVTGDAEALPLRAASVDLVYSFGVLHHTPDLDAACREARRVLKDGGKIWIALYHRDSIFYWISLFLFSWLFGGRWRHTGFRDRVSEIEHSDADERPLVRVYSRRRVRGVLDAAVRCRTDSRAEARPCRPSHRAGVGMGRVEKGSARRPAPA